MDYEKKYKEALKIARAYHKQLLDDDNPEWASEIEKIFPELRESEEERIRKALITHFQRFPYNLEGEDIKAKDAIAWLEKQEEQKLDDRVEPKFRVRDWVMYKNGACFSDGSISACVSRIEGRKIWLEHGTYVNEWELKKLTD